MANETMVTQVAVIGAGPGGIAAAIAAARQGAKVLLVERMGFVGGALASGLPLLAFLDMKERQVIGGVAQEFVDRLMKLGGSFGHRECPFHNSVTIVDPSLAKIAVFEMLHESNVDLLLHCELTGVTMDGGRIQSVQVAGKGQSFDIQAQVFIDGTGDGDLSYLSGASFEKGQKETGTLQPPTLMFTVGGVNFDKFYDYIEEHPEELPYELGLNHIRPGYDAAYFKADPTHVFYGLNATIKRLRDEGICPIDRDTIIFIRQPLKGYASINTVRILNFDGSNVHDLTRGELEGHLQVLPILQLLREHAPGFEDCYVAHINPSIGVRESRRVVGRKMLCADDAVAGLVPDDTIALGSYIIDIHSGTGETSYMATITEPYGIPFDCTVSADVDNLMMSGRCISVDAITFGSTRIMPVCMAVGEAAGVGAALAVKNQTPLAQVDVAQVREKLLEQGAILTTPVPAT